MKTVKLSMENLHFRYSEKGEDVINGISLNIPEGKISAILGPNGTGKTTLLHILLGFHKPYKGQILIQEKPLVNFSRREIGKMMGLVPQIAGTPFRFTVEQFILLGRAPYLDPLEMPAEKDYQIVSQVLEDISITHLKDRPISEISGGEFQLVLLARALAQQTKILLLDEPTSHLDLRNQNTILTILQELSLQGMTIVFTTHDPNIAAYIADNIILMRNGKIYADGSVADVLTEEKLLAMYGIPVAVEEVRGRKVVLMENHNK